MKNFRSKYGPWALVTGASSGIGEEFARQLAARGLNLVLVARREEVLKRVATELEAAHSIEVRVVPADLASKDDLDALDRATADLPIGLLVNNAGVASAGAFVWHDEPNVENTLAVNVLAPARLAHRFGQRMSRGGRGGIVFVSSVFAYQPVPYFGNYAATKAYIHALGEALHHEMRADGIDVVVLSPGPTHTAMMKMPGFDFGTMPVPSMEVEPVVSAALRALGRRSAVVPGLVNRFMTWTGRRVASPATLASAFGKLVARGLAPDRFGIEKGAAPSPAQPEV